MSKGIGRRFSSPACCGALAAMFFGGVASAAPVVTGGGQEGVTSDLFDIAQGTEVLDSSPMLACCGGSFPQNAFGGSGGVEPLHTLFSDGPITPVEFINFRTAAPVQLTNYTATLADDSDNPANPGDPNRGATSFRLYTSADANFNNLTLVSGTELMPSYSTNYGTNAILINDTLTNVTGQFFRVELLRANAGGPRVREVDGFGVVVPEPSAAALLLAVPLGLLGRRRPASGRLCRPSSSLSRPRSADGAAGLTGGHASAAGSRAGRASARGRTREP